jgi:hypothetical protein
MHACAYLHRAKNVTRNSCHATQIHLCAYFEIYELFEEVAGKEEARIDLAEFKAALPKACSLERNKAR